MATDIIIPLGTGSRHGDDELRLLLRSAERNVSDLRHVVIVTQRPPEWLANAVLIRCGDPFARNKDGNMVLKVMHALARMDLHGPVCVTCDDTLFTKPQRLADCPVLFNDRGRQWFADALKDKRNSGSFRWYRRLIRTFDYLTSQGVSLGHNYECHAPQVFDADILRDKVPQVDYKSDIGYGIFTLFRGLSGETGGVDQRRHKATVESVDGIGAPMDGLFAGYNDKAFGNGLRERLLGMFPDKSKYER